MMTGTFAIFSGISRAIKMLSSTSNISITNTSSSTFIEAKCRFKGLQPVVFIIYYDICRFYYDIAVFIIYYIYIL